jgi:hypothetical protein
MYRSQRFIGAKDVTAEDFYIEAHCMEGLGLRTFVLRHIAWKAFETMILA